MNPAAALEPIPLTRQPDGLIRVAGTRVPLDTVVEAFEEGATPEEISADYPVLALEDVYAVLTYYLRHRQQVQKYLDRRRVVRAEVQRRNEARGSYAELRQRLLARRCDPDSQRTPLHGAP